MTDLFEEDIRLIHAELEKKFPLMLKGIEKEGLIQAAIERQSRKLYGSEEQYPNIYKKTAALMEAITRWHIFPDGNKRTGLLCAFLYLYINNHYLAIPIDAVRFTQKIASTKDVEQEKTEELIEEIADWLQKFTAKNSTTFTLKVLKYNLFPTVKLSILNFLGFKKYVRRKIYYWFATDAHPEYKQESTQVFSFLNGLMKEAMIKLAETTKKHPKDLKLPILDPMRCAVSDHEVLLTEEDQLFESEPDDKGIKHYDSVCFHCRRKLHLETDPNNEEEYIIFELDEKEE
jgi:death-on-curing protein